MPSQARQNEGMPSHLEQGEVHCSQNPPTLVKPSGHGGAMHTGLSTSFLNKSGVVVFVLHSVQKLLVPTQAEHGDLQSLHTLPGTDSNLPLMQLGTQFIVPSRVNGKSVAHCKHSRLSPTLPRSRQVAHETSHLLQTLLGSPFVVVLLRQLYSQTPPWSFSRLKNCSYTSGRSQHDEHTVGSVSEQSLHGKVQSSLGTS